MTDIKHDAKWLHANGLDSKDIGNVRGAKAYIDQHRPEPFEDYDANYLYGLVGKLAKILDSTEETRQAETTRVATKQGVFYLTDDEIALEGDELEAWKRRRHYEQ